MQQSYFMLIKRAQPCKLHIELQTGANQDSALSNMVTFVFKQVIITIIKWAKAH